VKASLSITQAIDFYLSSRRPLGFALKSDETILRSLARYARQIRHQGALTKDLILEWARLPKKVKPCGGREGCSPPIGSPAFGMPSIPKSRFRPQGSSVLLIAEGELTFTPPRKSPGC
jgi:hypothetical protein